jgi:hypothetical protein
MFKPGFAGTYTLTFKNQHTFSDSVCIVFKDNETGVTLNLRQDTSYTFTVSDTALTSRFTLHMYVPSLIVKQDKYCSDVDNGKIFAQSQNPAYFQWKDVNHNIIKQTSGLVLADSLTNLDNGIYYLTFIDSASTGCPVTTQTIYVDDISETLQTNYVINDNNECNGTEGEIHVTVTGANLPYSYEWNTGVASSSLTGLQAGAYYLKVTDSKGCEKILGFVVNEPTPVSASFLTDTNQIDLANQQTLLFVNNSVNEQTITWIIGNEIYTDIDSLLYLFTDTGIFEVTLIAEGINCVDTISQTVHVFNSNPAVTNFKTITNTDLKLVVYPNPAKEKLYVKGQIMKGQNIIIQDISGRTVIERTFAKNSALETIDIEDLPNGIFMVKIVGDNMIYQTRVIKIK